MHHIPLRSCISCRKQFPQQELLALTKVASGQIFIGQHVAGRSVYLCSARCAKRLTQRKDNLLRRLFNIPVDTMAIQREVDRYFASITPREQD